MSVDFAKAKSDIAEIIDIVKMVPEALQERCFELLFEAAFSSVKPTPEVEIKEDKIEQTAGATRENPTEAPAQEKKLPPNILAFTRRHTVSPIELGKLFMLDHDPLLPIYKIPHGNMAKAQLTKVLMVLLENGLLNNALTAPYTELRESVKEDGLLDSNFNKMFKRNHGLFRGAISEDTIAEDGIVELTGAGLEKLAEVIKELGQ
jgi:hypothetical protein